MEACLQKLLDEHLSACLSACVACLLGIRLYGRMPCIWQKIEENSFDCIFSRNTTTSSAEGMASFKLALECHDRVRA